MQVTWTPLPRVVPAIASGLRFSWTFPAILLVMLVQLEQTEARKKCEVAKEVGQDPTPLYK